MSWLKEYLITKEDAKKYFDFEIETEQGISKKEYIAHLSMFPDLCIDNVISLFLDLDPRDYNKNKKHPRYNIIYDAIYGAVEKGDIKCYYETDINGHIWDNTIRIPHNIAKQWADTYGLKWNVPPYKPLNNPPVQLDDKDKTINLLEIKILELEEQLAKEQGMVRTLDEHLQYNDSLLVEKDKLIIELKNTITTEQPSEEETQLQKDNQELKAQVEALQEQLKEKEKQLSEVESNSIEPVAGKAVKLDQEKLSKFIDALLENNERFMQYLERNEYTYKRLSSKQLHSRLKEFIPKTYLEDNPLPSYNTIDKYRYLEKK
ncbi:hypothetical protein [Phocoenobacter skyensis]|uniref:Uncharacterized protein n=1 Tax=Phocoenobacter skyensis TaxID=97481 RepID=A0ABT9JLR4_9PAST|nr:hypothetical protein [Pasteurella skyensis]MDP8079698.1 hypothetical protein [Pasteurella skyensis]MDP8085602.1 hypothetical protein [Pasteurella skyensis]